MPATAGRVRMPANNRVHSSAALQTHGIWQTAIQYDPYAPKKNDSKNSSLEKPSNAYPESENAYASFQGLLALARISGNNADEVRGTCKKCGRVGHLTFQCRNFLSVKEDSDKDKDTEAILAVVLLDKIKGNVKLAVQSEDESEEEENESETSDSEMDSEIERIIAERYGKKTISKGKSSKKFSDEDRLDSDSDKRKRIGKSKNRSRKRTTSNAEYEGEGQRKRRKDKRRRRDESSDEEEGRKRKSRKEKRRSHR